MDVSVDPRIVRRRDPSDLTFVRREARCREPMLDLGLFRGLRFSAGIASGMLSYLMMFGVLFLVPFYLERGVRIGTGRAGVELMAMPLALGITAPMAGRLADRLGARPLTVGGMATVAGGLAHSVRSDRRHLVFWLLLGVVGSVWACLLRRTSRHHGLGGPGSIWPGLGSAQHDQRDGHRFRFCPHRVRIRPRGREVLGFLVCGPCLSVTALFLAAVAVVAGVIAGPSRRWSVRAVGRRPCRV